MPLRVTSPELLPGTSSGELPTPGVEARNVGESLARTSEQLGRSGREMTELALKMQDEQNQTDALLAEQRLNEYTLTRLREAEKVQGPAAKGIAQAEAEAWRKQNEEIGKGLNRASRELYNRRTMQTGLHFTDKLSRHEYTQQQNAADQAMEASLTTKFNLAAADPHSPGAYAAARQDIDNQLQVYRERRGLYGKEGDAIIEQKRMTLTTKLNRSIIDAKAADGDFRGAQKFFESKREEILGAQHDEIKKMLRIGTETQVAQEWLDSDRDGSNTSRANLIQMIKSTELQGAEAEMLADARKQFQGSQQEKVVAEIHRRFAERRGQDTQERLTNTELAQQIFARTRNTSAIPAEVRAKMDGGTLLAMESVEARDSKGTPTVTDNAVWDELYTRISGGEVDLNLGPYQDRLSSSDYQELRRYRETEKKRREGAEAKYERTISADELRQASDEMKWGNKTKADKENRGRFTRVVNEELAKAHEIKKGKLSPEERQDVIDRVLRQGRVLGRGSLLGVSYSTAREQRYYQVAGTPEAEQFIENDRLDRIDNALRAAKLPVSTENRLWMQQQMRERGITE